MTMPSKGWGPWRSEFYSFYSDPASIAEDVNCEFGTWRNVWIGKMSGFVYERWPDFWRWFVNLSPLHRRTTRQLRKFFPNL